ncbi:MAG: sterol desaturase family protein [Sphingomonadales bacterium]
MIARAGFWKKKHYLNKMGLRELVAAYFQYYAIQAYLVLGVISTVLAIIYTTAVIPNLIVIALSILAYPLAWYLLHRFVLHGRFLFKSPLTARAWKRIHYDHHQDPYDLEVLFGALYTTLPTIALVTMTIGYAFDGWGGAFTGLATGLFTTCAYEFCHCIQHLSYKPRNRFLQKIKKLHLSHHFHNERGNFGITNYFWDRFLGTYYERNETLGKSETVFNLGYDGEQASRYPWVERLTGGPGTDHPRDRRGTRDRTQSGV